VLGLREFYKLLPDVDLKECYFEGAWGFRKDEFVLANWREMSVGVGGQGELRATEDRSSVRLSVWKGRCGHAEDQGGDRACVLGTDVPVGCT